MISPKVLAVILASNAIGANAQTMFYPILAKPNQVAREIHKNAFAQFMKIEEMEEARKAELSEAHINDIERTDVNIDMIRKEENTGKDAVYVKGAFLTNRIRNLIGGIDVMASYANQE